MKFTPRGLDDVFTYPCTKGDVREAFGDELLHSASFGPHADHSFTPHEPPARGITGRVLLVVGISTHSLLLVEGSRPRASLYVYRARKNEWSEHLHWQVRETMKASLRPWVEAMLCQPETAWCGYQQRLVELREGRLLIHARRLK